jgi:eukaryotic-like serine/threonine-protein kinase
MSNEPGILPKPIPFGKYYLLERINVGGMAEVYKAKTFGVEGFERLLAVKKILSSIAEDESFINMFIDEAKIAGQLNHPNIAQIFDLGKVEDSYFIAMEYISGKDLKTIFERARRIGEKVDIPRVCYLIMKVCEGLAYAHEKKDSQGNPLNIVHRDISPQNVLLSYEGEVKIIDFGIAKATGKQSQTQVGILKGKFSYMSPEQVRGLHVDHRSDLFSLGIVLYEMLTLERLFLGESDFDTLEKIRKVEMSPPSLYNPHIPKELEDIVLKALAKSPDDRYQSAHELAEGLERFMRNQGYYFTNKDLASSMKEAFEADIEFENKKLEYYRGLNLTSPSEEGEAMLEKPGENGGLEWGEEEMETQIFDRTDDIESITESQIVYADDADVVEIDDEVGEEDATIEYNRWEVQEQLDQRDFDTGSSPSPSPSFEGPSERNPHTAQIAPQQRREPQVTVQSMSPRGQGRNPALVVAVVAALVIAVGVGVYFLAMGDSNPSIVFETEPKMVDIFINDEKVHTGETPYTYEAQPGPTEIRIESEGFEPYSKSLELEPDSTYSLNQALEEAGAKTGSLFVETEPPGATLEVDGEEHKDPTPVTLEDLEGGEYTIKLSHEGYFPEEKTVEIGSDLEEVSVTMRPETVSLTVRSDPKRAKFSIYDADDERVARGRTPDTVEELAGDTTYRVTIDRSGYESWEGSFEPGTDKENTLEADLERKKSRSKGSSSSTVASAGTSSSGSSSGSTGGGSSTSTNSGSDSGSSSGSGGGKETSKDKPKPKPAGTGTLSIASRPVARVHINGKDTGRYTPIIDFKIKAGSHRVRLVNEEFGLNKTVYVDVKAGENEKVINR